MQRKDSRNKDEMRPLKFLDPIQKNALGSVVVQMGETVVNCSATVENKVPPFLDPLKDGWLTSEYSLLPASTGTRVARESSKGKLSGRTMEIQRLIGRSLRAVLDLKKIPGYTLWIDCDVLQADGGTRTASITGSFVALKIACNKMISRGLWQEDPVRENVGAVSLGIFRGIPLLDLDYSEDSHADVDMNLVMTQGEKFVEIQSTSEGRTFSRDEFDCLLGLGQTAIRKIIRLQNEYLSGVFGS